MNDHHQINAQLDYEAKRVKYVAHRVAYLPRAIDSARRKLSALENEARRYGMNDLLETSATEQADGLQAA